MELINLKISKIIIEYNFNLDAQTNDLSDLMRSIKSEGLIQPIGVRMIGNKYYLMHGHQRLEASKRLGYKEIACTVQKDVSDLDAFIVNISENLRREDPTWVAYATAFNHLRDEFDLTDPEIAVRLSLTPCKVKAITKAFTTVPKGLLKDVREISGNVSKGVRIGAIPAEHMKAIANAKLSKAQIISVAKLSKAGESLVKVKSVIKLLRMGVKLDDAVNKIESQTSMSVSVLVSAKKIESLGGKIVAKKKLKKHLSDYLKRV